MAEERDPIRYAANRAAWRVVAEARALRAFRQRVRLAFVNGTGLEDADVTLSTLESSLEAALDEVEKFIEPGGVSEIMPGEPHYPEDWPA